MIDNIKDAILIICKEMNIDPELILKRGKPGLLQRNVRKQAQDLVNGTIKSVSAVHIDKELVISIKRDEIPLIVKKPEIVPRKIRANSIENFRGLSMLSQEMNDEIVQWCETLPGALKEYWRI